MTTQTLEDSVADALTYLTVATQGGRITWHRDGPAYLTAEVDRWRIRLGSTTLKVQTKPFAHDDGHIVVAVNELDPRFAPAIAHLYTVAQAAAQPAMPTPELATFVEYLEATAMGRPR